MVLSRRLPIVAAVAGAVALGCRGDARRVTLRYHPPQGASYRYTIEQHNGVKFENGPMTKVPEQQILMHVYFTQSITGPAEGGTGVTVRFDSTTIDSPMLQSSAFAPALDRLRGLTTMLVYDDRRNVLHATTAGAGEATQAGDQLLRGMKGLSFPFPDGPVGVGDSWTAEIDMPLGQMANVTTPLKTKTRLTIKEITAAGLDTTVLIALETTLPGDPIVVTQQGQPITMKLSGTLTGDQLFSLTRGAAVHSQLGGTIHINVTGGPLGAGGMDMTMTQATSLTLGGVP